MAHVDAKKTQKTAEKKEVNDFIGFLKDEVTKQEIFASTKLAILKKKQDEVDESILAVPSTSGNNVDHRIQDDHNTSKNVVPKVPKARPVFDASSNSFTFPDGDSNYLMPDGRWFIYDEYDGPDQFFDFFETVLHGNNDDIREYFDTFEEIIFNTETPKYADLFM